MRAAAVFSGGALTIEALLAIVGIEDVLRALGGGEVHHGRTRASWRGGVRLSVSVNSDRHTWKDFVTGEDRGVVRFSVRLKETDEFSCRSDQCLRGKWIRPRWIDHGQLSRLRGPRRLALGFECGFGQCLLIGHHSTPTETGADSQTELTIACPTSASARAAPRLSSSNWRVPSGSKRQASSQA